MHREGGAFRALDNVSFEVYRGESLGIIGRNGSGKSTLLGLVAGVLAASSGEVRVKGRVSPLLELGAGFHHELSGRENVMLNAVLLGMTRDRARSRMDEIIAFSELGEFIDQPIRTYSAGMVARLGFSVIAFLDAEIMLVDEVLAVGDLAFQKKCYAKMAEIRARGTTLMLVSHSLGDVSAVCDRAALIDHSRLLAIGPTKEVFAEYEKLLATT
jgi:lipopolysaccharide transport system ATP-binding protein